jgi:hypothetical protein
MPSGISSTPKILDLNQLIATKLSSYMGNQLIRNKDLSDVIELIKANLPPRDLSLPKEVRDEYISLWDRLKAGGVSL